MNPSKERAGAEQGLKIETGSIFLFDAFLVPGILAEFPEPSTGTAGEKDSCGLTLERHLELDALIQRARSSKIFGELDLLRVSSGGVSELAELQLFIDRQVGATALLERLHRAAELVDIEVRDHRLTALNLLVVVLTVLTIAIGVLQLVFS